MSIAFIGGVGSGSGSAVVLSVAGKTGAVTLTAADVSNVVVSPAQITSDRNDYNPGAGDIFRLSSDAARNITGVVAGTAGSALLFVNTGTSTITLKHGSTASSSANRFLVPWAGDYVMSASGGAALLVYDATDSRWRVV